MMVDLYLRLAIRLVKSIPTDKNQVMVKEKKESTFKKVYKFFKLLVDENLIKDYDEAYLCRILAEYLDACF